MMTAFDNLMKAHRATLDLLAFGYSIDRALREAVNAFGLDEKEKALLIKLLK